MKRKRESNFEGGTEREGRFVISCLSLFLSLNQLELWFWSIFLFLFAFLYGFFHFFCSFIFITTLLCPLSAFWHNIVRRRRRRGKSGICHGWFCKGFQRAETWNSGIQKKVGGRGPFFLFFFGVSFYMIFVLRFMVLWEVVGGLRLFLSAFYVMWHLWASFLLLLLLLLFFFLWGL